jgi:hypothetical protein
MIGMLEPAVTPPAGLADLTTLTLVTESVNVEVPVTGVTEFGGVPVAVAVSTMELLERSAWVTV